MDGHRVVSGIHGTFVEWPSGVSVRVDSPRRRAAVQALLEAASDGPASRKAGEYTSWQESVMGPLRQEVRDAIEEAVAEIVKAGDPA